MNRTIRYAGIAFTAIFLLVPSTVSRAQTLASHRPVKKLIEYGWDVPYPDQVRKDIRNMEKKPFDGIIFRLREWNHAFDPRPWDEAKLKPQLDDLAAIKWKTFTDNFLCLYAANNWKMDWFNDQQWKGITANLRLTAKAAKIGRGVGIVFDPEPYGDNPWAYAGKNKDHSFAEVEAQVRKRGAQFMAALQTDLPDVRLLTFFHQSLFGELLAKPDPRAREARLSKQPWALLSAFWNGALEAASPGARIIDGNEPAYYYTAREPFYQAYHRMKQASLTLVPPELWAKHALNFQAGMALYVDHVLALRQPADKYLSTYLTPQQRLRWFEHNVYYALTTSDEYVWCYSERMDWWKNKVPDGAEAAIRSARKKIADGRPLGFDISDMIAAGRKKMKEAAKAGAAQAASQLKIQTVVQGSAEHPRNGEGDILRLPSGDLLLVYGRWNKSGGGGDFGEAELWSRTSHDGGRTWGLDRVIVPNEGKVTTFEAGLLRLPSGAILLSYCVKNSTEDCSICFRKSLDEGRTWIERYQYKIPKKYTGYTGINNARLVRLKSGRILLPAYDGWVHGTVIVSFVLYSDDQGKTWNKSADVDIRDLAPHNKTGADEPAVIELKDGRVMMIIRTSLGFIAKSYSRDGGLSWSKPQPIRGPVSPDSPASIKRIPQTGDLLLVWNNNKKARRPLNSAISKDEGETWENIRCVDAAGGCYTSITPVGDRILLSYYGDSFGSLKLASIDYRWFYQPERRQSP